MKSGAVLLYVTVIFLAVAGASRRSNTFTGKSGFAVFEAAADEAQALRSEILSALDPRHNGETVRLVNGLLSDRLSYMARVVKSKNLGVSYINRMLQEGAFSKSEAAVALAASSIASELQHMHPRWFGPSMRRDALLEFISSEWELGAKGAGSGDSVRTAQTALSHSGDSVDRLLAKTSSLPPLHKGYQARHSTVTAAIAVEIEPFTEFWCLPDDNPANYIIRSIMAAGDRARMVEAARQLLGSNPEYSFERLEAVWRHLAVEMVRQRVNILRRAMPVLERFVGAQTDAYDHDLLQSYLATAADGYRMDARGVSIENFKSLGQIAMRVDHQIFYDILALHQAINRRDSNLDDYTRDMLIVFIVEIITDIQSLPE